MNSILDHLMDTLKDSFIDGEIRYPNRVWITVEQNAIRSVVSLLKSNFSIFRTSMITGLETSDGIEVLYHFERINELQLNEIITVRIHVSKNDRYIDSISNIMPGASLYEVELQEFLPIHFK